VQRKGTTHSAYRHDNESDGISTSAAVGEPTCLPMPIAVVGDTEEVPRLGRFVPAAAAVAGTMARRAATGAL